MQFLNPIFLVGLAAAAVPILLHFLSKRRLVDIPFAPLRFLVPTQERQMRRLNLRRLLLLLLRVAILAFVVMALARPTLTGGLAGLVHTGEGASAVLLVDASASMQAQVAGGTLFDRARREAVAIADELSSADEVAVVLFSDVAQPLFGEFVRDPDLVLAELSEASPTYRATDYVTALDVALDMLDRSTKNHREIYVVSDFQAAELDTTRLSRLQTRFEQGPPTNVFLRAVEPEPFVNRQVSHLDRPATLLRSGQTAEVAVVVQQDGEAELPVQVFLQVGTSTVAETELPLPPKGTRRHAFATTLPQAGDLSGSSRLRPDRYPPDDERFFVLSVGEQVPALIVKGIEGTEGERDPLLFLLAALDPTGRGDGNFAIDVSLASQLDVAQLSRCHVVVGSDLRGLGAARLAAVTEYLDAGGTMLLFVGDPLVRSYTNERLLPAWTDVRLGTFRGEEDTHERLEIAAPDHPVFAGFEEEELATIGEVRLRNFFRLPETVGRPLLRFSGGGGAVVELEVGRGRLILCGFHTAASAGDLPYSPMFLPIVQRLTGYLATAGWGRFGRHFDVGDRLVVEAPEETVATARYQVRLPSGELRLATLDASASPVRLELEGSDVPGIYEFLVDGDSWALTAVNVPVAESFREFQSTGAFRLADRGRFGGAVPCARRGFHARCGARGAAGRGHPPFLPGHRRSVDGAGELSFATARSGGGVIPAAGRAWPRASWLALAVVILASLPALRMGFTRDDWLLLWSVLDPASAPPGAEGVFPRPLARGPWMLAAASREAAPLVLHTVAILLNLALALGVGRVARQIPLETEAPSEGGASPGGVAPRSGGRCAWVAMLVVGLHPALLESRLWAAASNGLLAGCLGVWGLSFLVDSRSRAWVRWLGAALLGLAGLARADAWALALPAVFAVTASRSQAWQWVGRGAAVVGTMAALAWTLLSAAAVGLHPAHAGRALRLLVAPWGPRWPDVPLIVLAILAVGLGSWWIWNRAPLAQGLGWASIGVVASCALVPWDPAGRYLLVPVIALAVLLACAWGEAVARGWRFGWPPGRPLGWRFGWPPGWPVGWRFGWPLGWSRGRADRGRAFGLAVRSLAALLAAGSLASAGFGRTTRDLLSRSAAETALYEHVRETVTEASVPPRAFLLVDPPPLGWTDSPADAENVVSAAARRVLPVEFAEEPGPASLDRPVLVYRDGVWHSP